MKCRHCSSSLNHIFIDLGFSPPSNAYLSKHDLDKGEIYLPLKIFVCDQCWLAQTKDYAKQDTLFGSDYAYFSSFSNSWLEHAEQYVEMITELLQLRENSLVVEIAANDGYLLKNFVKKKIPCLGIEPTDSTAAAAESEGVPIIRKFFDSVLAKELSKNEKHADLIIGNNVYAHVPDINDFTKGISLLLDKNGVVTLEFPHLYKLIEENQFDTIYHEHYSYLSLNTVSKIFNQAGLKIWHAEELTTHGGSLRVFGCHEKNNRSINDSVAQIKKMENKFGMERLITYEKLQENANKIKNDLLNYLINMKEKGKKVTAYGAAAKGNTLLNYAGIKHDLLNCVYDASPHKQNKYLPGSHIPVYSPERIKQDTPDVILILPWNLKDEIVSQLSYIKEWGGHFITAIPELTLLD